MTRLPARPRGANPDAEPAAPTVSGVRPAVLRDRFAKSPGAYAFFADPDAPPPRDSTPPRRVVDVSTFATGRVFDDAFFDLDPVELELEVPAAPPSREGPRTEAAAPPSPSPRASLPEVAPRDSIQIFAGFGTPPTSLGAAPAYALKVLLRRRRLQLDLAASRAHERLDCDVYEAALDSFDPRPVWVGVGVVAGLAALFIGVAWTALTLIP